MYRRLRAVAAVMGIVVIGGCLFAWARGADEKRSDKETEREKAVTLQQVPERVRATILKQAGNNKITEIEEVTQGKKRIYEATWVQNGQEVEIEVASNGKLLTRETEEAKDEAAGDDDDKDKKEADDNDNEEEERDGKQSAESERPVTADQLPAAALAAIKKQAGKAEITAFAEEIEHGHTFYEGSFKGRRGANTDVLVTAAGALVEIEEQTRANQVPAAVLAAARKAAGKDAKLGFEKKTMILYEVTFQEAGEAHELLLAPCGSVVSDAAEKTKGRSHEEEENEDEQ